jgi:hypothetical protein
MSGGDTIFTCQSCGERYWRAIIAGIDVSGHDCKKKRDASA